MKRSILITLLSLSCIFTATAQSTLPFEERINGKLIWEAFEPQREVLQKSSAVVYTDEKSHVKAVHGVVVSEDGYLLTKASEVEGSEFLSVRVDKELFENVEIVKVDDRWDVALLKINAEYEFTPIPLSEDDDVIQGYWAISNGSSSRRARRVRLGIICAETREIRSTSSDVILGVRLDSGPNDEVRISKVSEGSGAERAGLKEGDIFLSSESIEIKELVDLFDALIGKKSGESIQVEILRGEKKMTFEVELMARPGKKMMSRNDEMSGLESISKRRDGFPRVIHHDTPLSKSSVGGPLLGLDGQCVGMNIARASRVATFAIPARELRVIIKEMMP